MLTFILVLFLFFCYVRKEVKELKLKSKSTWGKNMKKKMKRKTKMKIRKMMEIVPEEIKLKIFVRLPVESILRCRCVCKSWRSLLHREIFNDDGLYFANMHLRRSLENLKDSPRTTLSFFVFDAFSQFYFVDYDSVDHEYKMKMVKFPLNYCKGEPGQCMSLISHNGLVCVARRNCYLHSWRMNPEYIYNPTLREYVSLPEFNLPSCLEENGNADYAALLSLPIGFGYHTSTCEYKVVRLIFIYQEKLGRDRLDVDVYTIGKNNDHIAGEWRRKVDVIPDAMLMYYGIQDCKPAVLVNGSLHWLTCWHRRDGIKVVSFDLKNEELHLMEQPPFGNSDHHDVMDIMDIGGSLSVATRVIYGPSRVLEIWVMKDYMDSSSWVKQFRVQDTRLVRQDYYFLCASRNNGASDDQVLFFCKSDSSEIVSYGSASDESTSVGKIAVKRELGQPVKGEFVQPRWVGDGGTTPHLNSFVSLKALGEPKVLTY